MSVPHRSTEPARPRRRREMTRLVKNFRVHPTHWLISTGRDEGSARTRARALPRDGRCLLVGLARRRSERRMPRSTSGGEARVRGRREVLQDVVGGPFPELNRRDVCSMAWRCDSLAARRSQCRSVVGANCTELRLVLLCVLLLDAFFLRVGERAQARDDRERGRFFSGAVAGRRGRRRRWR